MNKITILLSRKDQVVYEENKVTISEEDITNRSAKEWFRKSLDYLTRVEQAKRDSSYIENYDLDLLIKNSLFFSEDFSIGSEYYYNVYDLFYDLCDEIISLLQAREYLTQDKMDELEEFMEAMSTGFFLIEFKLS